MFASVEWCTLPFSEKEKDATDVLVDILLKVPKFITSGQLASSSDRDTVVESRLFTATDNDLELELQGLLEELDSKYTLLCQGPPLRVSGDPASQILGGGDFCSIFPCTMYQSAIMIINQLLLGRGASTPQPHLLDELLQLSAFVIETAKIVYSNAHLYVNSGSCLHLVFLLEAVKSFSVSEQHRRQARELLECIGWSKEIS